MPKIVLIHGAWLSPACWQHFKTRYEALGHEVIAPAWPFDERPVAALNAAPRPELARMTVGRIVAHYERIVRACAEPPILIGHSFGGLFVQILLDRGLGCAGVAIDPAPARGVPPSLSALWGALPIFFAWRGWARTLRMTLRQFAWSFVHTLPADEQRALYETHVVPTPGLIYFQSAFASAQTKVDFANPTRAPLLLIAGDADRTVATQTVEATYDRYTRSPAYVELRHYPGRPHFLIATAGWEEVADAALEWAVKHSATAAPPHHQVTGVTRETQDAL